MSDEPLLISIEEAARRVGIGRDAAYRLVASGAWPSVLVGTRRRKVPTAFLTAQYAEAFSAPSQEAPHA